MLHRVVECKLWWFQASRNTSGGEASNDWSRATWWWMERTSKGGARCTTSRDFSKG